MTAELHTIRSSLYMDTAPTRGEGYCTTDVDLSSPEVLFSKFTHAS